MTTLNITDLSINKALDKTAMTAVAGGCHYHCCYHYCCRPVRWNYGCWGGYGRGYGGGYGRGFQKKWDFGGQQQFAA